MKSVILFIRVTLLSICFLSFSGCSTTEEYKAYIDAQIAQSKAQEARYKALSDIAQMGDTTAKVAAVMALTDSNSRNQNSVSAPVTGGQQALQWASVLLPTATQIYSVNKSTQLGMRQSDNATVLGVSTNAAFVGMASKIQAPGANMTLNGSGVLGSGSYDIGANSGANSGNSGKLSGTNLLDSTATPTIVRPDVVNPIVIKQEPIAPVIVKPEIVIVEKEIK